MIKFHITGQAVLWEGKSINTHADEKQQRKANGLTDGHYQVITEKCL